MSSGEHPRLILTRTLVAAGEDPRRAQEAAKSGTLTRVRPGAYADAAEWRASRQEQRHRSFVLATLEAMRARPVLSHESAAVFHEIPLLGALPNQVQVTALRGGGGRSSTRIHKHGVRVMPEAVVARELLVTTPARTAIDLARTRSFASGLAAADHVLHSGLATADDLRAELEAAGRGKGTRRARLVVERADGRAESAGESLSRAQMYVLRLPIPDLQHEVLDADGCFIGRVDFWWEELGLVGEFDGRAKYARGLTAQVVGSQGVGAQGVGAARLTAQAVWEEKRREDWLRQVCRGVVRWIWDEARRPDILARVLGRAGVTPTR